MVVEEKEKAVLDKMLQDSLGYIKNESVKMVDYVSYQEDKESKLKELFISKYEYVMEKFMDAETKSLDAHKQASILTISCLESEIIMPKDDKLGEDEINIFPEVLSVNLGLSYMLASLNRNLQDHRMKQKVKKYLFPIAFSCDTPYMEIICRILYYDKEEKMPYSVLDLSERYFLIEYITLLQSGIEPLKLKETSVQDEDKSVS